MKIIQIMPCFCIGGAESMCANLSVELKKLGHSVTAVSLYDMSTALTDTLEASGVKVVFLGKKSGLDLSIIRKLRKLFKQEKPDVIHTHLYILKYIWPAAIGLNIKIFHTLHSIGEKSASPTDMKLYRLLFSTKAVTPVALSEKVQKTVCNTYHLKDADVPFVLNGIPIEKYTPKADYSPGEQINLIHVGRFTEAKNHIQMIDAICLLREKYPNVHLRLVGDGELYESVVSHIDACKAGDFIELYGTTDNVAPLLHEADVFMLPSVYEGIPMTIIEAMSTALPIVASRVGGIPDMITDGENGLLCVPYAKSIAEKLSMLIDDATLRERLGKNAAASANRFSATTMAEKYLKIYEG